MTNERPEQRNDYQVVVAGGGPTGLMLAGELALAGVHAVIVERRANQDLDGSRAGGLHARTLEVFDLRGIAERFVSAGQKHPTIGYAQMMLDITDFPTRHNYLLALWQRDFEPILANWVEGLGVPFVRGREVKGFTQDNHGVTVELMTGETMRSDYLVGCDGGRSLVRKSAGIDFPGWDATTSFLIAEVLMAETPQVGLRRGGGGIGPVDPASPGGPYRVVLALPPNEDVTEPTLTELSEALIAAYGTDFGVHSPTWISRFSDVTRQAAEYRNGRVLLAGDAAHVHPPQGGQGLNTGVQDAVNIGWKLAQVVQGTSPESLLDTYQYERHPVATRVLHNTMAQVALGNPDDRHQALRETVAEWVAMDEPRKRIVGMISGLDIRYDLGEGHPLRGRRMPDLDIETPGGPRRVSALLHAANPVLLNFRERGAFQAAVSNPRVRVVDAACAEPWELPVIGSVDAPGAVLIRPDGYVAWVGDAWDAELMRSISYWFGEPSTG